MKHLDRTVRIVALVLLVILLTTACTTSASNDSETIANQSPSPSQPGYLPRIGDEVLVFTHRFNEGDFEEGKRIVVEDFSAAIQASGQTRRTYFLENPETFELVVLSYFHSDSSTEEWLADPVREKILTKLRPLYREPLQIDQLFVEEVHDTE